MPKHAVKRINGEVITALCKECKCCLGDDSHCATCHEKKSIHTLCGCGECEAKIDDYLERMEIKRRQVNEMNKVKELQNAA